MPQLKPVQYLEAENVWLMSSEPDWHCEIIIAGDAAGPAPARLAFLERIIPKLGDIEKEARDYLDIFVDRGRFANGEAWYFEGFEMGRDPAAPISELIMQFSLEADIYGFWTVTMQEHEARIYPVEFSRRQW